MFCLVAVLLLNCRYRLKVLDMSSKVISWEELEEHHGDAETVWTVIHGKVYDITKFLDEHPGRVDHWFIAITRFPNIYCICL